MEQASLPDELFNTEWHLIHEPGEAVNSINTSESAIIFGWEENRIFGITGCNRYAGAYNAGEGNSLTFENLISSQIGCDNSSLEEQYFYTLDQVAHYAFTEEFTILQLLNSEGDILLSFKKTALKRI